jgi:hypothetical protein
MAECLPKIIPNIEFSAEDFYHIAEDLVSLRKSQGMEVKAGAPLEQLELSEKDFQWMCIQELKSYLLRESNKALAGGLLLLVYPCTCSVEGIDV